MDLVTLLLVQGIAFLILLVWLKRRVDRELSADRALERIRKEIGDLITELNATTERNITLIEDRVQRLNKILESTDRKVGILKKEAEKHEVGAAMYTDIMKQHRRQVRESSNAVPIQPDFAPFRSSEQDSSYGSSKVSEPNRGIDANRDDGENHSSAAGSGDSAGRSWGNPKTVNPEARNHEGGRPVSRGQGLRNQVRDLHRAGLGADDIAKRLGSTVGEVELIIGLEARESEDSTD